MPHNRLTILTCPDRSINYLTNTIDSLQRAGSEELAFQKIIYVDGPINSYPEYPGWRIESLSPTRLGTKEALLKVMKTAADDKVDYLFYMEDDIILCKNALHAMVNIKIPDDIAFISYCDLKDIGTRLGIATAPGFDPKAPPLTGGHWGNQALVLPWRSLQMLNTAEPLPWMTVFASDVYISCIMAHGDSPIQKYGVFYPSLVQHVGDVSLVAPGALLQRWGRDTVSFPGEQFDAGGIKVNDLEVYEGKIVSTLSREDLLKLRFRQRYPHQILPDGNVVQRTKSRKTNE